MAEIRTVITEGILPYIPVIEPLEIPANGIYSAPSGVDAYNPITVNVNPAFDLLYSNYKGATDIKFPYPITSRYGEIILVGGKLEAVWPTGLKYSIVQTKIPTDALSTNDIVGIYDNNRYAYKKFDSASTLTGINSEYYASLFAVYGKRSDIMTQTTLFENTEATNPSAITLEHSIFDYDEVFITAKKTVDNDVYLASNSYVTGALDVNLSEASNMPNISVSTDVDLTAYNISSSTRLVRERNGNLIIHKIIGVNY